MKIYGLLMAAGRSRRFNGIKQLAPVQGQPLINATLNHFAVAELEQVLVVLGANAEWIASQLPVGARHIIAPDWQQGLAHSLGYALSQLPEAATHVLIGLADQPAIESRQIRALMDRAHNWPDKIVAACYTGSVGAPAIFPRAYFVELMALQGDRGAKAVLQAHSENLVRVEVPQAAIDIDTCRDLQLWIESAVGSQ